MGSETGIAAQSAGPEEQRLRMVLDGKRSRLSRSPVPTPMKQDCAQDQGEFAVESVIQELILWGRRREPRGLMKREELLDRLRKELRTSTRVPTGTARESRETSREITWRENRTRGNLDGSARRN